MISKTYAHHKPSEAAIGDIRKLRQAFSDLDGLIRKVCPQGRELSVGIRHLETSAMWAIKSVVCNDPNSVVESS